MSSSQLCVYTTSLIRLHTLRPHTGCPFYTESLLRASSTRTDRRWCLRASRPYCWQACGTRISRPSSCGGLGTNIALFIGSGEGNPHELLLANLFPCKHGNGGSINNLHPLLDFLCGLLGRVVLANPQESTPETAVSLHGLRLRNQEDGVPDVFGREWPPVVVELHTLPQGNRPVFPIGRHRPLLG